MNGGKAKGQVASESTKDCAIWKHKQTFAKLQKEVILQAGVEQKREEDNEEFRLKKDFIVPRATEGKATQSADHMKDDLKLINKVFTSIEVNVTKVKSCTRLGKKLDEKDKIEPQTQPLIITLESIDDTDVTMKKLSKLNYVKEELRNLRI